MRNEFKKIAEENTEASQNHLKEFFEGSWCLAQISTKIIDRCLRTVEIAEDEKKTYLLVMLRNCISDICCCLDSLERGHQRTIDNNTRMIFEDFCCVVHINNDDKIYQKFLKGEHQASKSIGHAKKLRPNDAKFKHLYGKLSEISHHVDPSLIARQMLTRDGLLSHLKPIDPKKLRNQVTPLLPLIDILRSIGEFAEEMCLQFLETPYFWLKPSTRNIETSADKIIQQLANKALVMYES